MTIYTATITLDTDTLEHAQQVIDERIGYDEDYGGFDYQFLTGTIITADAFYGMDPYYEEWRYAVAIGDTCLGLRDWITELRAQEAEPVCHLPRWVNDNGVCEHPDHDGGPTT